MNQKRSDSEIEANPFKELEQGKIFLDGILKYIEENDNISKEIFDSMSHELRTPAVVIKSYTDMLLKGTFGSLTKPQNEKLERIKINTELLIEIIFKMLEKKEKKTYTKTIDEMKNDSNYVQFLDSGAVNYKIKKALDESIIIAITDEDGTIIYVNDRFCDISKYFKEELIGKNHRMLKSGFHSPEFYSSLWKTISNGETWHGEIKNRAKDGSYYWVKTIIVPSLSQAGKKEYIAIRTEITARKQLEAKL